MTYNMSFVDNNTGFFSLIVEVNTASGGVVGVFLLIAIFIITFGLSKGYETVVAIMTSSFVTSIVGVLMFLGQLVEWYIAVIPIVIFFGSFLVNLFSGR
jgi:hypothetical protein